MNESFMRKIYEAGPELDENMMQQGLNFYGQQFKNLIQTFPGTDAPIFLAAMKAVHDSIRGVMPAERPGTGRRHFAARHHVCDSVSGREETSAKDKDQEPGTFMIQACRCRRCGGLLTSKEGVRNGIGHVCRMKALREMPDPNQVTVFDVLGDKEESTHEK